MIGFNSKEDIAEKLNLFLWIVQMKITIIYNNFARDNLAAGWGFSCLADDNEQKILFDTGNDGTALLDNLKKLDFSVKEIDKIIKCLGKEQSERR